MACELFELFKYAVTSIDSIKLFTWERGFLDIFIRLLSFTDEPNILDVTQKIQTLFQEAAVGFSELYLTEHFDLYASEVQNKILLTKREIRAKYAFPRISSLPLPAKVVRAIIPSVLENIGDLEKIDDPYSPLYVPETVVERIEDVLEELILLQNFVEFVSERLIEPQSQHIVNFFSHVLAVAGHASTLIWLYLPDSTPEQINVMLSDFLRMWIKPIQPCIRKIYVDVLQSLKSSIQSGWCNNIRNEDAVDSVASFVVTILHNLVDLPTISKSSEVVSLKDHLRILQKMLNFLRDNIYWVPIQDREFLQDIDTGVIDVGLLIYSLYEDEEEKEDMALGEVNPSLVLDLSGNIQSLSIVIYLTIRKAFQSNLPRIHGLGYVDSLLNNLKEFQSRHSDSLASVMDELQIIQKEFQSLQPFLEAVAEERHNDLDKVQYFATQLIGKAHEVEYIVDACISKEAPLRCLEHWLLDIIEEIPLIRAEAAEIHEKKLVWDTMNTITAHTSSNLARSPRMKEEIIGFEDVLEKLRDQLIKGTKGRDVISIVGMPGLGKTTLAYGLYSDRSVASHFDIHAQCCVSQVYSRKDLLMAILLDAINENSECRDNPADELADQLRRTLFSKRYLILLDDVWETSVWDDLVGCFQDANNGSRIILTTRNHEVAMYARFQSDPLSLRMFNNDESWELLRKKVFGEESFSPLLTKIGQNIAKKCGKLPLSVVLVAGILAEMEKKVECWEQLANNLGSHIHKDSRAVIEQSYQILPYHLRSCFLYFGSFLEDSVIDVSRLTRLWISEGFIKSCEGKSLEDTANAYLENLLGRNLVMGTKRSYGGEIKACRIHDLLHDFCKERAKEEMHLLWQKWDQNINPSSRVYGHMQLAHRMCIDGYRAEDWNSCLSHVVSIISPNNHLSFGLKSHIFRNFKFLKVLDLECTYIDDLPTDLVYLRYFSAQTMGSFISSFIANRWLLQTLKLSNHCEKMSLPPTLWNMVKLRHLHISSCSFIRESIENSKKLHDLKTLSTPFFSSAQEAESILRKTPNLRELRCEVKGVDKFQYYVLNFPAQIEKLKISYIHHSKTIPFCISAPNLRNLTLKDFYLQPQHLSEIAFIQNLRVLKLKGIQFECNKWEVCDGEFPQLRVLKLHAGQDHFEEWIVEGDAFPNLERLVLSNCKYLKEIPFCVGEISSLKSIEVMNCNEYVDKSAMDIRETQVEDYQNTEFEVFINHQRK